MWNWAVKLFDRDSIKYFGEIYWSSILHNFVNVWVLSLVWIKTHLPPFSWSPAFKIFWLNPCLVWPDLQSLCLHRGLACSVLGFQSPVPCTSARHTSLFLLQLSFWSMFAPKGNAVWTSTSPCLFIGAYLFAFQV